MQADFFGELRSRAWIQIWTGGNLFARGGIGSRHCSFQNGTEQYFGVRALTIRVDFWPGKDSSSCYGVNLASAHWVLAFFRFGFFRK